MALQLAPFLPDDGDVPPADGFAPDVGTLLARLGPVLVVVGGEGLGAIAFDAWCFEARIDSDGVFECLRLGRDALPRVYRLPDSDFLAWQLLAQRLPGATSAAPWRWRLRRPSSPRVALCGSWCAEGFRPQPRISPLGASMAATIARSERASLLWHAAAAHPAAG